MTLDPREFIRVHSGMPEHPKVEPLSDAAFRTLIEAWCLCRRSRNDGRIPLGTWTKRWKLKARKEIIASGLVRLEDDAAVMHDWLEHQPSAAELDHKRAVRAEAGRKGGQRSGQTRRERSGGEANAVANAEAIASGFASPENGHETVTFVENVDGSDRESDVSESVANQTVSDDVQTPPPAETAQNGEAIASVLLEQTPKLTRSKTQPDSDSDIDRGYVGGDSYVRSAPNSGEKPPPPKHHPEHPDYWAPDCATCTALLDEQIDWKAARVDATEPPAPYCPAHPGGTTAACGPCGDARRARQAFDAAQTRAQSARRTAETHRAAEDRQHAIAECELCDADGYRGTTLCDHDPDTADRARRGMAAVRAAMAKRDTGSEQSAPETTEEHTHV